jgi:hypothetical protein
MFTHIPKWHHGSVKNTVVMEYFIHETKWFGVSKSLFLLTVNEYKNTKAIRNCQSLILPYMKTSLGTIICGWCNITHLPETALLRIPGILWASFKVKAENPLSLKRMGLLTGRVRMLYRWFAEGKEKQKNSLCWLGLHIMNRSIHPLHHFQQKPALKETFVRDIVQWPDHHWDDQIIHISVVRSYPVFNLELPFGPTLDPKP